MGPSRATLIAALSLLSAALGMAGCDGGGNGGGAELNPSGYLSVTERRVLFIGWDQVEGELSGTIRHSTPSSGPEGGVSTQEAPFTATRSESALTFIIEGGHGFPSGMRASLDEEKLTVYVPTGNIVVPIELRPGTHEEYLEAARAMRDRLVQTPAPNGTPTPLTPAP